MNKKPVYVVLLILGSLSLPSALTSQNAPDPQTELALASQAFAGSLPVLSAALTGQVNWTAGSANETGQILLTARADGSSSVSVTMNSQNRSESQDSFANGQGCSWAGNDGATHTGAYHNCVIPFAWFLPGPALFSGGQLASTALSAESTQNGQIDLHWARTLATATTNEQSALLIHIGSYDLQFDGESSLPVSLSYMLHPDNNAGVDIPISVIYSDYRAVNGAKIPFHIQRYLNGVLSLDIILTDAVVSR